MAKTVSLYIEDDQLHADAVEKRVNPHFGKKFSPYVVDLIKKDLSGAPPKVAGNESILLDIARAVHPTLAPALEQQLLVSKAGGAIAQPRVLALFIEALHHALKRDFDAESPFQLWSSEEALLHQFRANPALRDLLTGGAAFAGVNEAAPGIPNSPATAALEAERRRRAEPANRPAPSATLERNVRAAHRSKS
jgi:hypothetical protein